MADRHFFEMKEPSLGEQLDLSEPLEVAKHHGGEGGGVFIVSCNQ